MASALAGVNISPTFTPQDTAGFVPYQIAAAQSSQRYVEVYQTITFLVPHRRFSLEELRLNDRAHGRGLLSPVPSPCPQAQDLVTVSLPTAWSWRHTSCRKPAELAVDFGTESVMFRVGTESETTSFTIHRNIITRRSAFVREALKGDWREAQSGIVPLPDDEPTAFALYQQWLYTGHIFSGNLSSLAPPATEFELLAKCYILGEKLLDSTFKDCVIDAIISLLLNTRMFDPNLTDLIYESTPARSAIRRLWQDIYLYCSSPTWLDDVHNPHPDFGLELSRRHFRSVLGICPENGLRMLVESCTYHEHEGGNCYLSSSVPQFNHVGRGNASTMWS